MKSLDPPKEPNEPLDFSHRAHRQLVGYLGFFLPLILVACAGLLPAHALPPWKILDSISAYYYTSALTPFVGMLFALSLLLFTYRGYEDGRPDHRLGQLGGVAALGVAIVPTGPPEGIGEPPFFTGAMPAIHYTCAVVLFLVFICFSLWLFRLGASQRRNRIYLWCGIIQIAAVLWALSAYWTKAGIFLPESIALMAFAISWLVKGRADETISRTLDRFSGSGDIPSQAPS